MRAGQFTDSYLPIVNGVSIFIQLFRQALEKLGHSPVIFTFGHTDRRDSEPNIVRSPGVKLGNTGYHIALRHTRSATALAETMDVIHTHHPFLSGRLAAQLCRRLNKPLIFTNHSRYDYYAGYYLPFLPRRVAVGLVGASMRRFAAQCDLILAVSPAAESMLRSFGIKTPIEIMLNGTDLERFKHAEPFERAKLDIPGDAFVFMYVGRLGPEKNLSTLLESFAHTLQHVPRARLVVIGGGPRSDALTSQARALEVSDKVHFLGMRPNDTIPSLLGAADAFVTASITEGHPMTIIEALAAGQPVLGFDVPGIREAVDDGVDSMLAPHDARALGDLMIRIASTPELRARLSEGARRSSQRYDMDVTARRIVDHYERLIREKGRSARPATAR